MSASSLVPEQSQAEADVIDNHEDSSEAEVGATQEGAATCGATWRQEGATQVEQPHVGQEGEVRLQKCILSAACTHARCACVGHG
jgi:hypothetical protein